MHKRSGLVTLLCFSNEIQRAMRQTPFSRGSRTSDEPQPDCLSQRDRPCLPTSVYSRSEVYIQQLYGKMSISFGSSQANDVALRGSPYRLFFSIAIDVENCRLVLNDFSSGGLHLWQTGEWVRPPRMRLPITQSLFVRFEDIVGGDQVLLLLPQSAFWTDQRNQDAISSYRRSISYRHTSRKQAAADLSGSRTIKEHRLEHPGRQGSWLQPWRRKQDRYGCVGGAVVAVLLGVVSLYFYAAWNADSFPSHL